jgi:DNA-binding LacI/PurR family transcriptional regulator
VTRQPIGAARAPNIRDVARRAGVSYQTVSRVLNHADGIRPQTRQRVLEAIEELDYRPNQAARALVTSRSRVIGVLVATRAAAYGVQKILYEIEDAAGDAGYRVAIATCLSDDASVRDAVERLVGQAVDALVVVGPQAGVFSRLTAHPLAIPFVMVASDRHGDLTVSFDQIEGARIATRHLIELGHTRILHLAGPEGWVEAEARLHGYVAELAEHGLAARPVLRCEWTADSGFRAACEVLGTTDVTAVFCSNDQTALGLLHALHESGRRVPRDMSVIGFDDVPDSAHYRPPLTTIRQDFAVAGQRAVGMLVARLRGAPPPPTDPVRPQLVVRASTGPPAQLATAGAAPRTAPG